jgi:hypothetical protein
VRPGTEERLRRPALVVVRREHVRAQRHRKRLAVGEAGPIVDGISSEMMVSNVSLGIDLQSI